MDRDQIEESIKVKVKEEIRQHMDPRPIEESATTWMQSRVTGAAGAVAGGIGAYAAAAAGEPLVAIGSLFAGVVSIKAIPVLQKMFDMREFDQTVRRLDQTVQERDKILKNIEDGSIDAGRARPMIQNLTNEQKSLAMRLRDIFFDSDHPALHRMTNLEKNKIEALIDAGENGSLTSLYTTRRGR